MIGALLLTEKHVVAHGSHPVSPTWRDLTLSEWTDLHAWRAYFDREGATGLQTAVFNRNLPHDPSLRDFIEGLWVDHGVQDLAVLYLHRGHQLDTRSPILQWLLHLLGLDRIVFAIRVEDEEALGHALHMGRALLGAHSKVLILNDEMERIAEHRRLTNEVSYIVLEKEANSAVATPQDQSCSIQPYVREMSL